MDFILVQQLLSRSSSVDDCHSFWIISENAALVMNGKDSKQKGRW